MTNDNLLTQYQSEALEALKLFMAIPGRINLLQMGRYGKFSEQTYRNTFTRDLRRLEFHFNASFAIIHNAYMLERFICVSGLRPNPQVIDKLFKELVLFTSRAA